MGERVASCACGQLRVHCAGEPVRISVCHCLECQKRSGSSFAAQARWPEADVAITGTFGEWSRIGDEGSRATFRFCPRCGSTVAYVSEGLPGLVAIAIGAFADPLFPAPQYSVYEERKHAWVAVVGDGIEHYD
ncbi:MAG: GFA family protein [Zymomonas sp.]|nr:MAG: GFA family protein [Zymomonas sp.]